MCFSSFLSDLCTCMCVCVWEYTYVCVLYFQCVPSSSPVYFIPAFLSHSVMFLVLKELLVLNILEIIVLPSKAVRSAVSFDRCRESVWLCVLMKNLNITMESLTTETHLWLMFSACSCRRVFCSCFNRGD